MTQDEIIEMAKEVGMDYLQYISPEAFEKVKTFVKLVAQHEREACAKIADIAEPYKSADLIRARGEA
jgi:sugar phosphate isomerase/epimerase